MYRSSAGDLTSQHDGPVRGERWDRDRFERMRGGGGGGGDRGRDEHDHFRFTEHDRFPGGRRDIDIHEDFDRGGPRGPPTRVAERERVREDERFDPRLRRRTEIFDDHTPSEVANLALAPYRRQSVVEKDIDLSIRRPARPGYIRRQSSLDTFDRRPLPRYNDYERDVYEKESARGSVRGGSVRGSIRGSVRDDFRPPTNVPIPLPVRERRFRGDEFEEVRYREVEREREREPELREDFREDFREEEFREVDVKRAKSTTSGRSRSRASRSRASKSIAASSARSSSSSSSDETEVPQPPRASWGRKGKTRLPKRLCRKQAVIDLGYPFEEEDDFIIVRRALEKEHIDEIIKISENYREEKTTYVYEDKEDYVEAVGVAPPPPPPQQYQPPPPPASVREFYTVPAAPQSVRSASPSRHTVFEERIEQSAHIGGPLTVLVPPSEHGGHHHDHHHGTLVRREPMTRSERDIKEEIRQLETERQMLRYEREADYEVIEHREPRREVLRIEKDRKVRKEPKPKLVAAMMATLT